MKRERNFWVIGGDMRQVKLAELLAEEGHTVHQFALERAAGMADAQRADSLGQAGLADCVILPLPVSGEGSMLNAPMAAHYHPVTEILDALRPGQIVCGGMVSEETAAQAAARGLALWDYYAREEFAVANAVPVALAVVLRKNKKRNPCEAK